jgi:hypothetical protein
MGIEVGKIPVIFDDDPRLALVWKGEPGLTRTTSGSFPFSQTTSSGGAGNGGDGGDGPELPIGKRPQLTDIVLKGFELYEDASGMQRAKAKFRIYNSSEEQIDGFLYAITISDKQGGRA